MRCLSTKNQRWEILFQYFSAREANSFQQMCCKVCGKGFVATRNRTYGKYLILVALDWGIRLDSELYRMASQLPLGEDPVEIFQMESFPRTFRRSPPAVSVSQPNQSPEPRSMIQPISPTQGAQASRCECRVNSYHENFD
jgi:hypothetical protein